MDRALHPQNRIDRLVLSAFDGELLIQDTKRYRAHALNPQAAAIFRLADGTHSVEEIAVLASQELQETIGPEAVWYGLGLLQRLHLLEAPVVTREDRITRKALLQRVGTAVALASIASITIPAISAHASGPCVPIGGRCKFFTTRSGVTFSAPCCSGACDFQTSFVFAKGYACH